MPGESTIAAAQNEDAARLASITAAKRPETHTTAGSFSDIDGPSQGRPIIGPAGFLIQPPDSGIPK